MYSFDSKIAFSGYHVYRNSTWQNRKYGDKVKVEIETNKSSKSIDPYACTIKIKHKFLDTWLTVGHIPREILRHCYFFLEGGNITGYLICTNYKVSPIPAGGLEVLLLLTFSVKSERIFELMKSFVNDLHEYYYTGEQAKNNEEESSNDEGIDIQITVEENATNENDKNIIEIDKLLMYIFISNST